MIGDPLRIRQILSNLVSNAMKFTKVGEVRVTAAVESAGDGATLVFMVIDTGIGIDAQAKARIFDKFTQADSSTTRRFGGAGLGLSICRGLVTLMGGSISLESTPGKGSKFLVSIPSRFTNVDIEPRPSERQVASLVASRCPAAPVLIVEEIESIRELRWRWCVDLASRSMLPPTGSRVSKNVPRPIMQPC